MARNIEMQRRHFEFIAKVIRDTMLTESERAKLTTAFIAALKPTNPQFQTERFREACTPTGKVLFSLKGEGMAQAAE